jgi:hypothetical protein
MNPSQLERIRWIQSDRHIGSDQALLCKALADRLKFSIKIENLAALFDCEKHVLNEGIEKFNGNTLQFSRTFESPLRN